MKNKLRGAKKVCTFAYLQSMKSKAMKIVLLVLCIIAFLSMPVASLLSSNGEGEKEEKVEKTDVKKAYVYDNTNIISEKLANGIITEENFKDVEYVQVKDKNMDVLLDEDNSVFLVIEYIDDAESLSYGINTYAYYNEDSNVDKSEAEDFSSIVDDYIKKAILRDAGADDEVVEKLSKNIEYKVSAYDKDGNIKVEEGLSMFQYYFSIAFITIMIIFVSLVGGKVTELIVTEKSTKVIEYLLTSVKPMAILVGKVIASTLVMLTMIGSILVSFLASAIVNKIMFGDMPQIITDIVSNGAMVGLNFTNVAIAFLVIVLSCIFYGFIAGIAGATVSKIEEMAEGMKIFTVALMVGAYAALFICIGEMGSDSLGVMTKIALILPFSSVFVLPTYLILGKATLLIGMLAIAALLVAIVLIVLLVSKVYEHMLYSNGEILKVKDIIAFAKMGGKKRNGK